MLHKIPAYPAAVMSTTELDDFIELRCSDMKTLKDNIQVALVVITNRYIKHGSHEHTMSLFNKLVNCMYDTGHQGQAAQKWVETFVGGVIGNIGTADKEVKGFTALNLQLAKDLWNGLKDSKAEKYLQVGTKGTHWCEFKPKETWKGYDLEAKMDQLVKSIDQAQVKSQEEGNEESPVNINQDLAMILDHVNRLGASGLTAMATNLGLHEVVEEHAA